MIGRYKAYPEYKSTDEVWLGDVPTHWRDLKINRLTLVKRGASPRPIDDPKYFDEAGEYAWVRIADVTASDTYLENTTQRLSPLGASLSVKLEPNELFISIAGTVGKPCINKVKACIHDGFVYFPEYKENTKFLFYIFAAGEAYKGLGKFGTQLNLNTETVGGIKIGIPSFEEQQKIVNFLDHETAKIDTLISKQEKLIELLKEKRQAVISHAVTKGLNPKASMKDSGVEWLGEVPEHWIVGSLRWSISISSGEGLSSNLVEKNKTELKQIPVIGGNGVMGFTENSNTHKTAIAIGRVGALCGNVHLINYISWITDNALKVSNWNGFDENYLINLLKAANLNDLASKTAQPLITGEQLKSLTVVIPPLEEQVKINLRLTEIANRFDKLEQTSKDGINLLKERKTALISAAVTGKIDVRDWKGDC